MSFSFHSLSYGPIGFQTSIPAELSGFEVNSLNVFSARGKFGAILSQQISGGAISMVYNICAIKEDLAMDFISTQPCLHAHIALNNDTLVEIKGMGSLLFRQGQFNLIQGSYMGGTIFLEKNKEYRAIDIFYPGEYLRALLSSFPCLDEFLKENRSSTPALLFQNNRWVNSRINEAINKVLNCSFNGEVREIYLDLKLKEILVLLLAEEIPDMALYNRLPARTIESMYEAKYFIETRFEERITVQRLAKQLGMSEFKLRKGFKLLFGTGLLEYVLKTRMQKAKLWLQQTDMPIRAIAQLTGYATKQSFLSAFKNYYHDTPRSFRKN